jgi:hypothetical protein
MYERFVERRAEEALSDTPVVLVVGPGRAGKTTLVRKMGDAGRTQTIGAPLARELPPRLSTVSPSGRPLGARPG